VEILKLWVKVYEVEALTVRQKRSSKENHVSFSTLTVCTDAVSVF